MKFGLIYELCRPVPFEDGPSEQEIYFQALEQIILADEIGFDYLWSVEHHFLEGYSLSSSPEIFLSAVAQKTKNIRIGNGVRLLPPPFNHPVRSAEMGAVLDLMSNGRYDFGVGRSITQAELEGFNLNPADGRPMLDEVLPQIVKMWTQDLYEGFQGKYFSMPSRKIIPKPIQDPHPPIWMACTQPSSFQLAGDFGVGILAFGIDGPTDLADSINIYKQSISNPAKQVGLFVNNSVGVAGLMYCSQDPKDALENGYIGAEWYSIQTAKLFAPWVGKQVQGYEYYTNLIYDKKFLDKIKTPIKQRLEGDFSLVGTPEKISKAIENYQAVGVDQVICLIQAGRIPHDAILESLKIFAQEVIPRFS